MTVIKTFVERHKIATYFALACAITWALVFPLVGSSQGWIDVRLSPNWHALGALGPISARSPRRGFCGQWYEPWSAAGYGAHHRGVGFQSPRNRRAHPPLVWRLRPQRLLGDVPLFDEIDPPGPSPSGLR